MAKRPPPREIVIGRSYLFHGHIINLVEQVPDGVICCRLDDEAAVTFVLRWDQIGLLGAEVPDA